LTDASDVQVLHRCVLTIQVEVRHTLRVLLQRNGDSRVGHAAESARACHISVVESVWDVKAVERGRSGEQVGVSLVVVRFVEVEGVAGEAQLGDQSRDTVDVISVALSLAAIEDGRVQGSGNVVEGLWVGTDGWDSGCDLFLDVGAVVDVWRSKQETLLKVRLRFKLWENSVAIALTSLALCPTMTLTSLSNLPRASSWPGRAGVKSPSTTGPYVKPP
jgi:hypothetical protein